MTLRKQFYMRSDYAVQEYFTRKGTSSLLVKGCIMLTFDSCLRPWSSEISLSRHTCCDMGPRHTHSHPKDSPIYLPFLTGQGTEDLFLLGSLRDHRGIIKENSTTCSSPVYQCRNSSS